MGESKKTTQNGHAKVAGNGLKLQQTGNTKGNMELKKTKVLGSSEEAHVRSKAVELDSPGGELVQLMMKIMRQTEEQSGTLRNIDAMVSEILCDGRSSGRAAPPTCSGVIVDHDPP